jgi:hypothetical protein
MSGNASLSAKLAVRPVYPLWTNRRLINGVVEEDENLLGDPKLELVIEGVMDDIKVWCDAQNITYTTWTDIDSIPIAIKRATTYGTVAALYSRRTNTFQSRVIPSVQPVTITVKGDAEKAMEHWENRMKEMLELYMSASGGARLVVSTADEEPVFSMADIPSAGGSRDVQSWMQWVAEHGYPDEVEEE